LIQWIGLRENLQETHRFLPLNLPLNQTIFILIDAGFFGAPPYEVVHGAQPSTKSHIGQLHHENS
jgi:hypothetical protein